jgi:hypothetical protein
MKNILYVTYDGLTDPLGQSQVIPYLAGLSKYGHRIHIVSAEKKNGLLREEKKLKTNSGMPESTGTPCLIRMKSRESPPY